MAELIQAGGETLLSEIHKLINSVWNKEELPDQWKESIIVPVHKRVIKLTVIIILGYHCYQLHTKFYRISSSQG
jgi:cytochrome b